MSIARAQIRGASQLMQEVRATSFFAWQILQSQPGQPSWLSVLLSTTEHAGSLASPLRSMRSGTSSSAGNPGPPVMSSMAW